LKRNRSEIALIAAESPQPCGVGFSNPKPHGENLQRKAGWVFLRTDEFLLLKTKLFLTIVFPNLHSHNTPHMRNFRIVVLAVAAGGIALLVNDIYSSGKKLSKNTTHNSVRISEKEDHREALEGMESMQWMNRTRAYPNADIPADAYVSAMNRYAARFGNQQSTATGAWTSIGPNNIGGRTLCVAVDPVDTNKIWLGSAGGGLWKSTVGGIGANAWTYVPTGFPVIGVSTVAINPVNPQVMYIGTGETYNLGSYGVGLTERVTRGSYGMGILKSTDGGLTWTQSLNWTYQQQEGIWEIVINPLRPNTVFAATTQGVYKSTDAGASWNQVLNIPVCMDLALLSNDTTVIMCGAGDVNSANKGLYRSTDGGLNWSLVSNGFPTTTHQGRITIELFPSNNSIAIAQLCDVYNTIGFYKTTDKGASWTNISSMDICGYQGWYCKGMEFMSNDVNTFLAGGVNMYSSTDGGANYFQISDMNPGPQYMHSDVHDIVGIPQNPNDIFVVTDGGLFRSWDFGVSYTECTDGYTTSQAYIGAVSQTNPDFALTGLQDNFSIEYNGSPYWTPVLGGDGCYCAIDPTDDTYSFVAYQYLNVYESYDQGASYFSQVNYEPSSPNGGNPCAFMAPYIICPSQPSRMYAGTTGVIRSDDAGASWPVVSADPIDNGNYVLSIATSYPHPDSVYIATAPDNSPMKLMLSTDGGVTFTDRSTGLPDRFPRRIAVDPRNGKIVYVVFSGFGTGHVYKSMNAGVTWNDITGTLPDVPTHCVFLDPQFPDVVYIGSDAGLFVSTNGGTTWTSHNTGLPDWTMVYDLVSSNADRSLKCFTHGHGVWERSLNDVINSVTEHPAQTPFSISVFPNPANENATLVFGETSGVTQITILDISGNLVYSKEITFDPASPQIRLDVSTWADGCYIIQGVNGNRVGTQRILVQH
jgi:hypothetical protein